ncbi:MAG: porin [Gammaproteobacteria bacterium]|nr:porin [Gammaproteobacteria bacterium]
MNKKLISLAVAAAVSAPMLASAETTLYGRLDTMLNYQDGDAYVQDQTGNVTRTISDSEWDVNSNTTRFGIKGSEDLGNGLKAIFQAEWAFNSAEGGSTQLGSFNRNRLAYAGLSGNWGTAAIGRQWTPYYGAVDKTDIFNNSTYNAYYIGTFRTGNAISYATPNWNGFSGGLAVVVDDDTNQGQNGIDAWNLALNYENGPIDLGFGYHNTKGWDNVANATSVGDYKGWGLAGAYTFGNTAKISGQYEAFDVPFANATGTTLDWKSYAIAGEYYMGNNTFRALWGQLDFDFDKEDTWALGWQYNFSKRTRVYVEYGEPSGASRDTGTSVSVGDGNVASFGLRHYF